MKKDKRYVVRGMGLLIIVIALLFLFWHFQRLGSQENTEQTAPVDVVTKESAAEKSASKKPRVALTPVLAESMISNQMDVAADVLEETDKEPSRLDIAINHSTIPEGGALLTGGWVKPDGSRMFVLMTPKQSSDNNQDQVEVSGLFFSIAPDKLTGPGWDELIAENDKGEHLGGATYDADQLVTLRENYVTESKNLLSAPRVTAKLGQQATLSIGGESDGLILSFIATKGVTEGQIELRVTAAEYRGVNANKRK
jgi:hypothetical protein